MIGSISGKIKEKAALIDPDRYRSGARSLRSHPLDLRRAGED